MVPAKFELFLSGIVLFLLPASLAAQAAPPAAPPAAAPAPAASNPSDTLKNLGFGVALGLQWNILKPDIVNDAVVDANGIVRVNTRANTNPGLLLEMHYLVKTWNNDKHGFGPFVAAQPGGNNQIISAVGAGLMYDWKVADNGRKGFGLGFGYAAIPSAKTLGDEFVANKPAPLGPDGKPLPIRFQTRDKGSVMLVLSFTF